MSWDLARSRSIRTKTAWHCIGFKAHEGYQVGAGKGPVEAYLYIAGIAALAKTRGVDAIHPGYGFQSKANRR
jgi:pyruvate carboxylase